MLNAQEVIDRLNEGQAMYNTADPAVVRLEDGSLTTKEIVMWLKGCGIVDCPRYQSVFAPYVLKEVA